MLFRLEPPLLFYEPAPHYTGVRAVLSVPDGAPGKVKAGPVPAPDEDRKFEYLWNCRAALDPLARWGRRRRCASSTHRLQSATGFKSSKPTKEKTLST